MSAPWVDDPDKALVVSDADGNVVAVWHDYYQRVDGTLEPADPPKSGYEAGREVLSKSSDFPADWRAALDNGNLAVDAGPSDIQTLKKI